MIKIENTSVYGWEAAIRGARNPMNSWKMSDSKYSEDGQYVIGPKDLDLMKRLARAGSDHGKYLRMIHVTVDLTAPLYWWKEADTYKVGTVANSCSTMHKIHTKEFELDDFSIEHLTEGNLIGFEECVVNALNTARNNFLETKDKLWWWQMIQLLPSSYNQKRTIDLNYEVLRNMYFARKTHKLDEWHALCDWIESLPYFKEIFLDD